MRIEIYFNSEKPVSIPIQYNHIVQAVIYSWISDEKFKNFIHNKGYKFEERVYKLFTFSKINGAFRMDKDNRKIIFYKDMRITISSVVDEFMEYLLSSVLIGSNPINIGGANVEISRVEVKESPDLSKKVQVYTLSPVTAYSTLENKQTRFYNPFDMEFSQYIKKNLLHKYEAYHGNQPENTDFVMKPIGAVKEARVNYKGFHILAYNCEIEMEGSEELLRMAYDAGIGGKNSMGLGCIEVKNRR
ncbi:MAG: CRISPR-associated endoribonuclease Cas6 [Sedimentibacter sp.]|uniref:CRISPR-associated endoribonuclease Cas6 n=1 Tax=Sedimentibacter sp. TaxID=1960295 RepID=UPI0029822E79|nr:CRISPR-associated endoribonuclease Cas6 [Sedimentibacter sp.]MDW5298886.1 CRISPR-associated endoribonuclease Cas6 [Sedimentibacter sp.]